MPVFRLLLTAALALAANAQLSSNLNSTSYGPNAPLADAVNNNDAQEMRQAGWRWESAYHGLNNLDPQVACSRNNLHFYRGNAEQARLAATLQGSGCARITFSNCWNTQGSFVGIWLNNTRIAQTDGRSPSAVMTHQFTYTNGQVLEIRDEGANAVAEIANIQFLASCNNGGSTGPNAAKGDSITSNNWPAMQTAGWRFTVAANGIGNLHGRTNPHTCNEDSFHFYRNSPGIARLSVQLTGSGCAVITYSQCWTTPNSFVGVYLNNVQISRTLSTQVPSPVVTHRFSYTNGQTLEIRDEGANGVAEIESLIFIPSCTQAPTSPPTPAPTGWYQAPGLPDLQTTYTRLQSVESQLVGVTSTLNSQAQANAQLTGQVLLGMQSLALAQTMGMSVITSNIQQLNMSVTVVVSNQISGMSTQVAGVSNAINSLRTVLTAAVQNAVVATTSGTSQPASISSTAGGSIAVVSGSCNNQDLCGAATFAQILQQALSNV